ncbi:MAG: zinc-ribbon domain-containing protein [Pseudomonadota bacterium]
MRLTCPNCDAQYEVPSEVIPPEGRDVQCSNCGDTWYQEHPDHPSAPEAEHEPVPQRAPETETPVEDMIQEDLDTDPDPGPVEPEIAQQEPEPEPEPFSEPEPEEFAEPERPDDPEPEFEAGPEPEPEHREEPEPETLSEAQDEPAEPAPAERAVDPAISNILREEAERETQLRAHEGEGLESQPDLGLDAIGDDEADRRARQAQDRMARMRGEEPAAGEAGSRRGLLPDIDEINSSLRNEAENSVAPVTKASPAGPAKRRRSGGFLRGFTVMIVFGLILAMLYINAAGIAASIPQAEPMLSAFVALVDQARVWLQSMAGGVAAPSN